MTAKRVIVAWLATTLVFLGLDAVWLTQVAPHLDSVLAPLLVREVRVVPAVAFYLIYLTGIVVLAEWPALAVHGGTMTSTPIRGATIKGVALRGAVLGFVAYATYDLTNQATLKLWSTAITLADLTWGAGLTALAAAAGALVSSRLNVR